MSTTALETVRTEDYVEYFLFPDLKTSSPVEDVLQTVIQQIKAIADRYCEKYIWHKDGFRVTPRYSNASLLIENQLDNCDELPAHIYGITHFEENIQDEWFIVSLLFEISRQIPGIIVRVVDADGEFMLIEAAEHLPEWANPETCEQRLYIHDGYLHLVRNSPTNETTNLMVSQAIHKIRNNPTLYKVSQDITKCIGQRLEKFPSRIAEDLHRATVYLPLSAACLLKHKPQFVADAIRAFCHRDQIDMKACRAMKYFPPENRVYTSAVMTKCLYAMLSHNPFTPDRRTGWNVPPQNHKNYKAHMLGVKLACGFEILASQAKPEQDITSSRGWQTYMDSLIKRGYFQGYLEHSKDYNRLLESAKEYFKTNLDNVPYGLEVGNHMLDTLKQIDCCSDDFQQNDDGMESDNDDWLNVSPDELDKMLNSQYGMKKTFSPNGNSDASEFTDNLTEFLDKKSEFDGIEIEPVPPKRGIKKKMVNFENQRSSNGTESDSTNQIDFNPETFQSHIKDMLDLIIPEDSWESNSDLSDFADDDNLDHNIAAMTGNIPADKMNIKAYMQQMDKELAGTTIANSFEKKPADDSFEDIENFEPVDIDVNALKNIAQSYQSQFGGPGPATSLLGSMGIQFKSNDSPADDKPLYNTQV
ncbi:Protein ecdysoneless [Pseudolycoriella hygida]|uniref:Protein ecdysoneless n=1 Tax=Pseudolycoriella hygida TaxID=35572 RepID=A0A9Q0N1H5_9DIPT|nr:Protein ecdysoneless [Pseudolycoriella hygida]